MDNYRLFDQLLNKYLLETITEEETRQFFALLEDPACQALLKEDIGQYLDKEIPGESVDPEVVLRIKQRLVNRTRIEGKLQKIRHRRLAVAAAAAVLVLIAGLGVWIRTGRSKTSLVDRRQEAKSKDIPPGRNGAVLTLADGTTIDLDTTGNGKVSQQGNVSITKANGLLTYEGTDRRQPELLYNTVTVPPAHQIQLSLPDGSRVWLNAASSLRFPTSFKEGKRIVELTGEGYFEIAHKAGQPFVVKAAGIEVQDIGTQFDVMAYTNEPAIKTTLVEGAARVVSGDKSAMLRPNDQANISKETIAVQQNADVEEAIAWKNGLFQVNGADLAYVLRQIGRWYDMEIEYSGDIPKGHMIADIPRSMNLSNVIELLRQFGISCQLKGKRLIIAG